MNVHISDIWKDKTGKHWRVTMAHKDGGDIKIMPCSASGRVTGGRELTKDRETFLAEHAYVSHASI